MCRYLRALLNRCEGLLTPESYGQLIQPLIPTGDGLHGEHYGLGLFIQNLDGDLIIGHSGGMVGYQAHLLADLDAGLGVITLTNSPYDPRTIAHQAWKLLTSSHDGQEISEILAEDLYLVDNVDEYVGLYCSGDNQFSLISHGEHLYLDYQGDSVLLEPADPEGVFLVPHPAFELFLIRFRRGENFVEREKAPITEAYHGPDVYLRHGDASRSPVPSCPSDWQAYPGHYRSHNPWFSNFRVVLRKGELFLVEPKGVEEPLHSLGAGLFRVGSNPRSPEFIRFSLIVSGKAMRADLSGGVYSRTFTP
jgi:hypothetical protein